MVQFVMPVQTFVWHLPLPFLKSSHWFFSLSNKKSSMVTRQGCHHSPGLPYHLISPQACCSTGGTPALTLKVHYPLFRLPTPTEIRDRIDAVRFTSSKWRRLISFLHPLPLSRLPVTTYILLTKEFLQGSREGAICRKGWTSLDSLWHVTLWKEG